MQQQPQQPATPIPTSPPAEQWLLEYAQALPQLEQLAAQAGPWPLRVLRSSQLDAQRLDAELLTMLQEQFMAVFQLLPQGQVSSLEPELNLLLAALVFWLSVWRGRATPGSELMNLRYRNERAMDQAAAAVAAAAQGKAAAGSVLQQQAPAWLHGGRSGVEGPDLSLQQRAAYAAGFVALPYLWLRVNRFAASRGWGQQVSGAGGGDEAAGFGQRCWRLLRGLDAAHKLCMVVNLWVFLYQGKYRTLVERLIGARLVYRQPNMSRLVSFEYLNRQLVWQELSEFLLFLLPLINVTKVRRAVLRILPKLPMLTTGGLSSAGAAGHASSSMQYPVADLKPPLPPCSATQPAASPSSSLAATAAVGGQHEQEQHLEAAGPQACQDNSSSSSAGGGGSASSGGDNIAELLRPLGPCPICSVSEILVPFVAHPCGHIFCYYCLQSHCAADSEFQCPVDGMRVAALQRYVRTVPHAVAAAVS